MSDKTIDQVGVQVGEKVLQWLQAGEEFVVDQAPELAHEIVLAGIVDEMVSATMATIVAAAFAAIAIRGFRITSAWENRTDRRSNFDEPTGWYFVTAASVLGFLIMFGVAVEKLGDVIGIAVAPRLYVIETLSGLVK